MSETAQHLSLAGQAHAKEQELMVTELRRLREGQERLEHDMQAGQERLEREMNLRFQAVNQRIDSVDGKVNTVIQALQNLAGRLEESGVIKKRG